MSRTCPHCEANLSESDATCPSCGAVFSETPIKDPLIGRILLNQYVIKKKLGEGGFGCVYEAYQPSIERKVAIKTLHKHLTHHANTVARFRREGAAASRLTHPAAVKIYNVGETEDGYLWISMEFLDGETLHRRLARGALSEEELLQIFFPICDVLQEAHQKGILHRDLKPDNIFLLTEAEGSTVPKLLDFGIAALVDSEIKATQSGMVSGTPPYMSPEQWKGLKFTDARSDIYALGIIAYECLSGRLPFAATTGPEFMAKHCFEPPLDLVVAMDGAPISPAIRAVIMTAMAKNPDERYQTPLEFKKAMQRAFSEPFSAPPLPPSAVPSTATTLPTTLPLSGSTALPTNPAVKPPQTTLLPNPKTALNLNTNPGQSPANQAAATTSNTVPSSKRQLAPLLAGIGVVLVLGLFGAYRVRLFDKGEKPSLPISGANPKEAPLKSRWLWENPKPQGNPLTSLWSSDPSDLYAVGWGGVVLHSQDTGKTWSLLQSGVTSDLYGVWGSFVSDVYAVGDEGTILHSVDRGQTWEPQVSGTDQRLLEVWGSGRGDVYVVGENGLILHSQDSGKSWQRQQTNLKKDLYSLWGASAGELFVVGAYGTVLRSIDGGATWTSQRIDTTEDLYAAWGSGKNDIYFVGARGSIFHSPDAGANWVAQKSGTEQKLSSVWGAEGAVYVAGDNGLILGSKDQGKTWQKKQEGGDHLYSTWGTSAKDLIVVGDFGEILRSGDQGQVWASQNQGKREDLLDVWVSPIGELFASGIKGLLLYKAPGDQSVAVLSSGVSTDLHEIRGDGEGVLYVAGHHGVVLRSADNGKSWLTLKSGTTKNLFGILTVSASEVYAIGEGGLILRSVDSGVTWKELQSKTAVDLWRGAVDPKGGLYFVGNKGTVLYSQDGESFSVQKTNTSKDLWALWVDASGVYAAGDAGTLLYSADGVTWGQGKAETNSGVGGLWGAPDGTIYAVGDQGVVMISTDKGKSWARQWSGTARDLWAIYGSAKTGEAFAVGLKGTILHSR
jgi:eukaryotic-like serine/threonine-protein kinase